MKIVYIYTALLTRGGVDRVLTVKANYLAERLGHEVWVVTDSQCGRPLVFPLSPLVHHVDLDTDFDEQYHHGILRRYMIYRRLMRQYRSRLETLLQQVRPDIVCTTLGREMDFITDLHDGSFKVGESHIAKAFCRNLHLMDARGFPYNIVARLWRHRLERSVARLDRLVVLTQRDAASWAPVCQATVIPNPITIEHGNGDSPRSHADPPLPHSAYKGVGTASGGKVISVGRLSEQKAHDRLLRAWAKVVSRHADWQLEIWGEGVEQASLQRLIDTLGLGQSCRLMGITSDIAGVLTSADIYAMSSRFEGLPLVLIEAMSMGLPPVAMDCPTGPREIITDGRNGLLVGDGDEDALSSAICRLIENPDLRHRLASQAKTDTMSRFGLDATMQRWEELFTGLVCARQKDSQ